MTPCKHTTWGEGATLAPGTFGDTSRYICAVCQRWFDSNGEPIRRCGMSWLADIVTAIKEGGTMEPKYLKGDFDPNSFRVHRPSIRSHQEAENEINGLRDCMTAFAEQAEQLKSRLKRIEADLLRDGPAGAPESVWTALKRVTAHVEGIEKRQRFDLEAGNIWEDEDDNVEESALLRYLREAAIRAAVDIPGNIPESVFKRTVYMQQSCQGVIERNAISGESYARNLTRSERATFQRALAIFNALVG